MKVMAIKAFLMLLSISLILATVASESAAEAPEDGPMNFGVDPGATLVTRGIIRVNNESDLAALVTAGVASGSGTHADPYIIQNFQIDANLAGNALFIGNTTSHVLVSNCSLYNAEHYGWPYLSGSGVALYQADNVMLVNNSINSNGNDGVLLYLSNNITIVNNDLTGNDHGLRMEEADRCSVVHNDGSRNSIGFYLFHANNITLQHNIAEHTSSGFYLHVSMDNNVSENVCNDNTNAGIYIDDSYGNTISWNDCSNNSNHGIQLSSSSGNNVNNNVCPINNDTGIYLVLSNDNHVSNNSCGGNHFGISLAGSNDNAIIKNACVGNTEHGIRLHQSDSNTVTGNNLHDNLVYGIHICSSTANMMYGNILSGNNGANSTYDPSHVQAHDNGTNHWNTTTYGNYWGDWTSPDDNADGIVDQVYVMTGGINMDHYPLAKGALNITSPHPGTLTNRTSIEIYGTASGFGIVSMVWNNAADGSSGPCLGTTTWTGTVILVSGQNNITVTMTDIAGRTFSDSVAVTCDAIAPNLVITSPADGSYDTDGDVTVTWTGNDPGSGIAYYKVSVDGVLQVTTMNSTYALVGLTEGVHVILVGAYDAAGNRMEATVTTIVDLASPTITITSPADGSYYTKGNVTVTWTASDNGSGIDHYLICLDGGTAMQLAGNVLSNTFSGLGEGGHVVNVTAVDMIGNQAWEVVSFIIDTFSPSLNITSPADGSFNSTRSINVAWTGIDDGSGISHFYFIQDGQAPIQLAANTTYYSLTELAEGPHIINLTAVDLAGNEAWVEVGFMVDATAPVLVISSPNEGSYLNASSGMAEWTTFDEGSSILSTLVRMDGGEWQEVCTATQWSFTSLLDREHTFEVKVRDRAGNHASATTNFTIDTTVPTADVWPTGDWVAPDATIVVKFSEVMNVTSVSIVVEGVSGAVTWSGNTATFHHLALLAHDREYLVNVTGEDLAGNRMEISWAFNTSKLTSFIGTVNDEDGDPLAGVTVTVSNSTMSATCLTGPDGTFEIDLSGNISGPFTIAVDKDGYLDLMFENVTVGVGGTYDLGTLTLEPEDGSEGGTGYLWPIVITTLAVIAMIGVATVFLRKKK